MQTAVIENEVQALLTDEERQPCEVWTRVMGYFRPVSSFNRGKKGEFHERASFVEPCS
jgi:anaerobic ribonucleoside-triphosphate reductase